MRHHHLGQAAEGKTVNDDETVITQGRKRGIHRLPCVRINVGEAAGQSGQCDPPAQLPQLGDDVAVVEIAASALARIAGKDEVQLGA